LGIKKPPDRLGSGGSDFKDWLLSPFPLGEWPPQWREFSPTLILPNWFLES